MSTSGNKAVSVVMAVHNGAAFVGKTIESILSQDHRQFEFIIIDDASTDDTPAIVASFQDARIRYSRNERNIGQTASLNIGIRQAQGEYIARIDADDIAKSGRFKEQVNFLDAHPEVAVVGTWQETIDIHGRLQGVRRFPTDPWQIGMGLFTCSPLNWFCLSHPTVMIRKSALEKVGLFDETLRISQDYDLWLRISRSFSLANIPYVGLQYRAHGQSLSQKDLSRTKSEIKTIIGRNVDHVLPGLNSGDREALIGMLLFDPLKDDPKKVMGLFDRYLKGLAQATAVKAPEANVKAYSERLKVLYVPQIIKQDPLLGLTLFFKALFFQTGTVISKRFLACVWYSVKRKW